jgi:hypothetical protein
MVIKKMEISIELSDAETQIKKEMKHFMALTVMSIAFGGIAMAFAISSLTTNVFGLRMTDSTLFLNSLITIAISLVVACLALWFIISTAEVLSKFDEVQEDTNDEKSLASEKLTERIITLIGLYREEKPQIKRMILVSKIAGVCFFANALVQTVILFLNLNSGSVALDPTVGGIFVSLVMGLVGFFLPSSFQKYSVCWDERILKSIEAEKKIVSFLEEPL